MQWGTRAPTGTPRTPTGIPRASTGSPLAPTGIPRARTGTALAPTGFLTAPTGIPMAPTGTPLAPTRTPLAPGWNIIRGSNQSLSIPGWSLHPPWDGRRRGGGWSEGRVRPSRDGRHSSARMLFPSAHTGADGTPGWNWRTRTARYTVFHNNKNMHPFCITPGVMQIGCRSSRAERDFVVRL